ncbi:MAG TPA: hypothetical protein VLV86_15660, partial [Vicinamibacterales bacterium]|nr:hypothetical protein [Vicinamibacterales bacterium]
MADHLQRVSARIARPDKLRVVINPDERDPLFLAPQTHSRRHVPDRLDAQCGRQLERFDYGVRVAIGGKRH